MLFSAMSLNALQYLTNPNAAPQTTFVLEYQDGQGNWIPYDSKYSADPGFADSITIVANTADYTKDEWKNPLVDNQLSYSSSVFDPRTARWGVQSGTESGQVSTGSSGSFVGTRVAYLLESTANARILTNSLSNNDAIGSTGFSVFETQRPRADKGNNDYYKTGYVRSFGWLPG